MKRITKIILCTLLTCGFDIYGGGMRGTHSTIIEKAVHDPLFNPETSLSQRPDLGTLNFIASHTQTLESNRYSQVQEQKTTPTMLPSEHIASENVSGIDVVNFDATSHNAPVNNDFDMIFNENVQPKSISTETADITMNDEQIVDNTPLSPAQQKSLDRLNAVSSKIPAPGRMLTRKQKEEQAALPMGKRFLSKTGEALGIKSQGVLIKKPLDYENGFTKEDFKQLTKDQLTFSNDLITKLLSNNEVLRPNDKVFGGNLASLLSDANERIKRVSEIDLKTRDTIQETLKELQAAESKMELTGSYEFSSLTTGSKLTSQVQLQAHQQKTAENLIQSQIDNVFGVNALSGQSNFSLTPDVQEEMVAVIKKSNIFDTNLAPFERLQAIADMSDAIMNRLSADPKPEIVPSDTENSTPTQKPIATFKTTINSDGSYQSSVTNDTGASSSSTVNNSGKLTRRVFSIPGSDGITPETIFTTNVDSATGVTTTKMENSDGILKILSVEEDSFIQMAHAQLKAMANIRSIIKATLWTGKQTVMNLFPSPVSPVHSLYIAAISPIVIKGTSMLMGYKWSDPTVRTSINAAMELTCGNSRGWLSADPNRIFTQGSAPSRLINVLQGKGNITGANLGSATYKSIRTLSFKPLSQALETASSAKIDPLEEYYHALDDNIIEAGKEAVLWFISSKTLITKDRLTGKTAAAGKIVTNAFDHSSLSWMIPQKIIK
jgi:hypothetical protein